MTTERFSNTYRNASTAPSRTFPPTWRASCWPPTRVLAEAAELVGIVAPGSSRRRDAAGRRRVGSRPEVFLPLGEVRRMGGLPSTRQGDTGSTRARTR